MGYLGLVDTDEPAQGEATPVRAERTIRPTRDRAGVTVVGSTIAGAPSTQPEANYHIITLQPRS